MVFEIYKNGKTYFKTEYESCVPSVRTQQSIRKAGYRIKIKHTEKNKEDKNDVE